MDNRKLYSEADLRQPVVKLAEALDAMQGEEALAGMTTGRQAGFTKADCEDIVDEQMGRS